MGYIYSWSWPLNAHTGPVITAGESLAIAGPTGPDRVHRQQERKHETRIRKY